MTYVEVHVADVLHLAALVDVSLQLADQLRRERHRIFLRQVALFRQLAVGSLQDGSRTRDHTANV